jgi:hypothetical protein
LRRCSSTSQKIHSILWQTNVHCRVHNNPALVLILSQINLVQPPSHFFKIYFLNIILLSTPSFEVVSYPQIPHQCASPLSPTRQCHAHLILRDLITGIILGEKKSRSSSLCTFSSLLYLPPLRHNFFSNGARGQALLIIEAS